MGDLISLIIMTKPPTHYQEKQTTGNFLQIPADICCVKKVKSLQTALIRACHLDQTLHLEVMKDSYASKV